MNETALDNELTEETVLLTQNTLKTLPPLAEKCIDKAIDNVTRKFVGGMRNKKNSQPNTKNKSAKTALDDTLAATSAKDAMEASNRGVAWKEMIEKSLSHGISSIKTLKFDGEFTVRNGEAVGLKNVPNTPGVYVVYDKSGDARYVGDAGNLQKRWVSGHLNENRQKERNGERYKLADEFTEGCTVKFVKCDSIETAAAIEAHLIKEGNFIEDGVNKKDELKEEQGTRSNQEAKKMKDASGSTTSLAKGAAIEGLKQGGYTVLEQIMRNCIKILKDELVDIFLGGESQLIERIKRFFRRIWQTIVDTIKKPLDFIKGIFEFILNAFSETIRKVYNLARNIFDLGVAAWELYKGNKTMSKQELINKISETIITSGCLIIWDALDAIIEIQMTATFPPLKPYAPYLAAAISAIGFGVSSHYLCDIVPKIVEKVLNTETGHHEALREQSEACKQLVINAELNLQLVTGLKSYVISSAELCNETVNHTKRLSEPSTTKIVRTNLLDEVNDILS